MGDALNMHSGKIIFFTLLEVRICGPSMLYGLFFTFFFFSPLKNAAAALEDVRSPKLGKAEELRELSKDVAAFPSNLLQFLPSLCSLFFLC